NGNRMSRCIFLLFVCPFFSPTESAGDPIESIVSNFMLTVRSMGEKWLANVAIPNIEDVNSNPNIAYSVDTKTANALSSLGNFLNACPVYLPLPEVEGTWHVAMASKRLLQTTFANVDQARRFSLEDEMPHLTKLIWESLF
ncbi:hypothetical protein PMAYCL1PPCAC_29517, partial [Pristionchus mayeri]